MVTELLSLLFLLVIAVAGLQVLPAQRDQDTLTLGVTIFWFYLALPVSALLMMLIIVARLVGFDGAARERPPGAAMWRRADRPPRRRLRGDHDAGRAHRVLSGAGRPGLHRAVGLRAHRGPAHADVRRHGLLPAARHPVLHHRGRPHAAQRRAAQADRVRQQPGRPPARGPGLRGRADEHAVRRRDGRGARRVRGHRIDAGAEHGASGLPRRVRVVGHRGIGGDGTDHPAQRGHADLRLRLRRRDLGGQAVPHGRRARRARRPRHHGPGVGERHAAATFR